MPTVSQPRGRVGSSDTVNLSLLKKKQNKTKQLKPNMSWEEKTACPQGHYVVLKLKYFLCHILLTIWSQDCVWWVILISKYISASSKTRRLTSRKRRCLNHSVLILWSISSKLQMLAVFQVGIQIHPSPVFSIITHHCYLNFVQVNKRNKGGISICVFKGKKGDHFVGIVPFRKYIHE